MGLSNPETFSYREAIIKKEATVYQNFELKGV
jgi:hypothetical protein